MSHVERDCQMNAKVCVSPTIRLKIGGSFTALGAIAEPKHNILDNPSNVRLAFDAKPKTRRNLESIIAK